MMGYIRIALKSGHTHIIPNAEPSLFEEFQRWLDGSVADSRRLEVYLDGDPAQLASITIRSHTKRGFGKNVLVAAEYKEGLAGL